MKAGVLTALKGLLSSMVPKLRLHAVWAFKNLAQECESEVQGLLLSELTWSGFKELLMSDDDVRVREQATGLLQNLLCKGAHSVNQVSDEGRAVGAAPSDSSVARLQQQPNCMGLCL